MCGRYTQMRTWAELLDLYGIAESLSPSNFPARYNIAPTQAVPVVRRQRSSGERELVTLRWGLVPSWAKNIDIGARMINARAETVADKPSFRAAFKERRCLIVADGFYEWQAQPKGPKQPFFITVADARPFALAGLWEEWWGAGSTLIETCTIVTTEANPALKPIHARALLAGVVAKPQLRCPAGHRLHGRRQTPLELVVVVGIEDVVFAVVLVVQHHLHPAQPRFEPLTIGLHLQPAA